MLRVTSLFCGCGGMDKGILGGFDYLGHYYAKLPLKLYMLPITTLTPLKFTTTILRIMLN